MFSRIYRGKSANFWAYEDILLKTYLDIASTGDFTKLIKSGKATDQECLFAWEEIVRKQEKVTGTNQYNSFLQLLKGYASLINDHTVIRACLIHMLYFPIDCTVLKTLREKGYPVEINGAYAVPESIQIKLRTVENLVTKATMKYKEIQRLLKGGDDKKEKSFHEVMAWLNFNWPNAVNEDIKLCTYNEYQRILRVKQKAMEEANQNGRRQNRRK